MMKSNKGLELNSSLVVNSTTSHSVGIVRDESLILKSEDEIARLNLRRSLELELVKKFDRAEIDNRKECWYLIDSNWLNAWGAFTTTNDADPPGKLSSKELFEEDLKTPLKGLRSRVDYRAVPPIVYFIFCCLYGKDGSPDICRYAVDIYKPAVPPEHLVNIQYSAKTEATIQVNKIRPQWVKWERDDCEEDEDDDEGLCCGFCTKAHLEAFIYWMVHCWARKSTARKGIKYSQYKPISTKAMDDSRHSEKSVLDDDDTSSEHPERGHESGMWLRSFFTR